MPPNTENQTDNAKPSLEVPLGRFPYGWNAVAATRVVQEPTDEIAQDGTLVTEPRVELLPFPKYFNRQFTHEPRTIILGSAKRGGYWAKFQPKESQQLTRRQLKRINGCKPTRYIVWGDRSLRRVDKVLRKQFSTMTPAQQNEMMSSAMSLAE